MSPEVRLILKGSVREERLEHQERADYSLERFEEELRNHLYSERGRQVLQPNSAKSPRGTDKGNQ